MWRVLCKYMYGQAEVDKARKHQFVDIVKVLQRILKETRNTLRQRLPKIRKETKRNEYRHPERLVDPVKESNQLMVSFAGRIIDEAIRFMADDKPPCDFLL